MTHSKSGLLAMIAACTVWGLSPIYYKLLAHVPPLELLAHRTLWSLVVFAGLLMVQGRISALGQALKDKRALPVLAFSALMITANWFLFIFSIQAGQVTQTSLGYYMFPLVSVLLGVIVMKERLAALQWIAVALATLGVVQLTWGLGAAPWISLILAGTFGLYGLVKRNLKIGPVVSVTGEVALLALPAAGYLLWVHGNGAGHFGTDALTAGMLIFSGVLTALPLVLFSSAAQKLSMSTVGLLQYVNPTLQFFCAVVLFGEALTIWHTIAFALIWTALALYSGSGFAQERARRKSAMTSAADSPL
ncbi:EamA family transporter RarD [Pacificoceanicola onchidii]|uniref:EamA family transporter RarD n=1 Tax=Pacificoceanicola onchidii TaxID=2562685 RepID=UPI0010A3D67B|nr:EamA family transporter RarD [Pacificoceanicola onchidii]